MTLDQINPKTPPRPLAELAGLAREVKKVDAIVEINDETLWQKSWDFIYEHCSPQIESYASANNWELQGDLRSFLEILLKFRKMEDDRQKVNQSVAAVKESFESEDFMPEEIGRIWNNILTVTTEYPGEYFILKAKKKLSKDDRYTHLWSPIEDDHLSEVKKEVTDKYVKKVFGNANSIVTKIADSTENATSPHNSSQRLKYFKHYVLEMSRNARKVGFRCLYEMWGEKKMLEILEANFYLLLPCVLVAMEQELMLDPEADLTQLFTLFPPLYQETVQLMVTNIKEKNDFEVITQGFLGALNAEIEDSLDQGGDLHELFFVGR